MNTDLKEKILGFQIKTAEENKKKKRDCYLWGETKKKKKKAWEDGEIKVPQLVWVWWFIPHIWLKKMKSLNSQVT